MNKKADNFQENTTIMIPGEVDVNTEISYENTTEDKTTSDEEQPQPLENQLKQQHNEASSLLHVKQAEIEQIEGDLNELMDQLNNFTKNSQDESDFEDEICNKNEESYDDQSEKQDGPQEKVMLQENQVNNVPVEDLEKANGLNQPVVNWDAVGPLIQNLIKDLKQINQLNNITTSLLKRLRSIIEDDDYETDN